MQLIGWMLIIIALVLAADAIMALLFGRRYLRWGASLFPPEYRGLFQRFIDMPVSTLLLLGFLELALALSLHWLGYNLIK